MSEPLLPPTPPPWVADRLGWEQWRARHEKRHKLPPHDGEVVCEECQGIYAVADTRCEKGEQGTEYYWCLACYGEDV